MAKFVVGEQVEFDFSKAHHAPGSTVGLLNDPTGPPDWVPAVIEAVHEVEASPEFDRYSIRLPPPIGPFATGDVGGDSLRPRARRSAPIARRPLFSGEQ